MNTFDEINEADAYDNRLYTIYLILELRQDIIKRECASNVMNPKS